MQRGADGEGLPAGEVVFRLWRATNDGRMPPEAFHLSSADKRHATPRLSVWAESLTKVWQAGAITGGRYAIAGFLPVDDVRQIRPEPDNSVVASLDVVWDSAVVEVGATWLPCTAPGSEGHCGIAGLYQERSPDGQNLKAFRKSMYAKLARLANQRIQPAGGSCG